MNKSKVNIFTLIGAILCLVSMLFGYASLNLIIFHYPISWSNLAWLANKLLYAVPVLGFLMLISAFIDSKAFKGVVTVLALAFCIYYFASYRNVLNGELVKYIVAGSTLLSNALQTEVDISDVKSVASYLTLVLKPGFGSVLFTCGTALSIMGLFIGEIRPAKKEKSHSGYDDDGAYSADDTGSSEKSYY